MTFRLQGPMLSSCSVGVAGAKLMPPGRAPATGRAIVNVPREALSAEVTPSVVAGAGREAGADPG